VKEQLKKIGGMEFYDVHFSYIDIETKEERFISVPEQGGGALIPDGPLNPGVLHTVATGSGGMLGLYRMETQVTSGNGSLSHRRRGAGVTIHGGGLPVGSQRVVAFSPRHVAGCDTD
jgi:predicted ATP-dependent Lon-type protease